MSTELYDQNIETFFNIDYIVDVMGTYWPEGPTTWENATMAVLSELAFSDGYSLDDMEAEHIEAYYDDGRIDILARAALNDLRVAYEKLFPLASVTGLLVETLAGKQRDYGPRNVLKFGEDGLRVRIWDKIARLNNIKARGHSPVNETLLDTKMDIVGYTVILVMLRMGWFELPLEGE